MPSLNEQKRLRSLLRRKERAKRGLLIAEGARVVGDVLDSGRPVLHALVAEDTAGEPAIQRLAGELERREVRVERVARTVLSEYADTVTPQGILVVTTIPAGEWDDLANHRLLVVDGVQDPGNLGTLIRTAEALGAGGVIVLPGTTDPWSPKAVRAAAGASFRLPVIEASHDALAMELADRNVPLWATAADGEPVGRGEEPPERVAIAVGNEGAGVSGPVRVSAARTVGIEQAGAAESLNVAVAAAILLDRIFGGGRAGSR